MGLFLFSGTCGSLSCVAGNDDFCGPGIMHSGLEDVPLTEGPYIIVVGGYARTTGDFELTFSNLGSGPPSVGGDPHVVNMFGEKFDLDKDLKGKVLNLYRSDSLDVNIQIDPSGLMTVNEFSMRTI